MRSIDCAVPYRAAAARVLLLAMLTGSGALGAATIGVGTPGEVSGTRCTLRNAIEAANTDLPSGFCTAGDGADTIVFARLVGTVTLSSELLVTGNDALTIDGRGNRVIIERAADAPAFSVLRATGLDNVLTLRNIQVRGGRLDAVDLGGAGISSQGDVVLEDSLVSGNVVNGAGAEGGAIHAAGDVRLIRSEVSDNLIAGAEGSGGGIRSATSESSAATAPFRDRPT